MRLLRLLLLLVNVISVVVLLSPVPATAQTAPRRESSTRRTAVPKPDRRLTLMVTVTAVPAPAQAIVQATASSAIEKPIDLVGPFPLALSSKTKLHYGDGRSVPFTVGETIVVRADLFGMPPSVQAAAREIWDVPSYEAYQRLRKEIAVGKVAQGMSGNELTGTLLVTRDDGTQAEYRITEKSRFCRGDRQVLPSAYPSGTTVAIKPRGLPGGAVMAAIVAESTDAVNRAHRDTLTVWRGILDRAEVGSFYLVMRRDDGAKRKVRFPKVIKIVSEADEKKAVPGRVYQFGEIIEKPIVVHLVRGERPDPDGTRTADRIALATVKSTPTGNVGLKKKKTSDKTSPAMEPGEADEEE